MTYSHHNLSEVTNENIAQALKGYLCSYEDMFLTHNIPKNTFMPTTIWYEEVKGRNMTCSVHENLSDMSSEIFKPKLYISARTSHQKIDQSKPGLLDK